MRVNESGWETWNETHRERERERDCRFVCGTFVERIEMNIKLKNQDKFQDILAYRAQVLLNFN